MRIISYLFKDHPNLRVLKMTQEIGFVEPFDRTQQIDFEKFPIGGTLELVQYHSCDTAARFQVGNFPSFFWIRIRAKPNCYF